MIPQLLQAQARSRGRTCMLFTALAVALMVAACRGGSDNTVTPIPTVPASEVSVPTTVRDEATRVPDDGAGEPDPTVTPASISPTPEPPVVHAIPLNEEIVAEQAVDVWVGQSHTCAMSAEGDLYCWGWNRHGQLGDGSTNDRQSPARVSYIDEEVMGAAIGGTHTCVLDNGGGIACWGGHGYGNADQPTPGEPNGMTRITGLDSGVAQVVAGVGFSCALMEAGIVHCWGANSYGQLGDGEGTDRSSEITDVLGFERKALQISAGSTHACALLDDGTVYCWGWNERGQLGNGTHLNRFEAEQATMFGAGNIAVEAGVAHTCVINSEGGVECVGANRYGQLGSVTGEEDSTEPITVTGLSGEATSLAAGDSHTCALLESGELECWGGNFSGQLGDGYGDTNLAQRAVGGVASAVTLGDRVKSVDVGGTTTCAVLTDGSMKCWGYNRYGNIGDGSQLSRILPTDVAGFAGYQSDLGVRLDQRRAPIKYGAGTTVVVDISNAGPESPETIWLSITGPERLPGVTLGISGGVCESRFNRTLCSVPGLMAGTARAFTVTVGGELSYEGDVALSVHGSQADISRANDTVTLTLQPVVDSSGIQFVSLSSGVEHSCGLDSTGSSYCWGSDDRGQVSGGSQSTFLPDGTTPAITKGLSTRLASLSAGDNYTCGITAVGSIECWGDNSHGQMGNGLANGPWSTGIVNLPGSSKAETVASGATYACASLEDGSTWCWGSNAHGQLGDGTRTGRTAPVQVTGIPDSLVSLSAAYHTCGVTERGEVYCWGRNSSGQLGHVPDVLSTPTPQPTPTSTPRPTPTQVTGPTPTSHPPPPTSTPPQLPTPTATAYPTATPRPGITPVPTATQVPDAPAEDASMPGKVNGISDAVSVSVGYTHSCALTSAGRVFCWGEQEPSPDKWVGGAITPFEIAGFASPVTAISAGGWHTCALMVNGTVACWGNNQYGQLGTNDPDVTRYEIDGLGGRVESVSASAQSTCAIVETRGAVCWGYRYTANRYESAEDFRPPVDVPKTDLAVFLNGPDRPVETGHEVEYRAMVTNFGSGMASTAEIAIELPSSVDRTSVESGEADCRISDHGVECSVTRLRVAETAVISIKASYREPGFHSVTAVTSGGRSDPNPDNNSASVSTIAVEDESAGAISFDAGSLSACAIDNSGRLMCWGGNYYGQLGDGTRTDNPAPMRVRLVDSSAEELTAAPVSIAVGGSHACAVDSEGAVHCWGWKGNSALGLDENPTFDVTTPVKVIAHGATQVTTDGAHTCALLNDGSAMCWGSNRYGALGNGSVADSRIPTPVDAPPELVQIDAGSGFTCARMTSGESLCWGINSSGQLGDGTTDNRSDVAQVRGIGAVTDISAGGKHACAVVDTGEVMCWGSNEYGQLGDGTTADSNDPVKVVRLPGKAVSVSAGSFHTCALVESGNVFCWGDHEFGWLGYRSNPNSAVPVRIPGLSEIVKVVAGPKQSCASTETGRLFCWGANIEGQLGDGTIVDPDFRVQVAGFGGNGRGLNPPDEVTPWPTKQD